MLNTLAVSQDTGKPSPEFLKDIDITEHQSRSFVHDWIAHGTPKVEEFEQDYAWAHANNKL